jgi:hypothetical protein
MPSSATITAFYNFTANTKARASQVNNNYDVFRGHLIPVEVSTATSANNTYDLGSSDYYWRNAYVNTLYVSNIYGSASDKIFSQSSIFDTAISETSGSFSIFPTLTITSNAVKNYEIGLTFCNTSSSDAYLIVVGDTVGGAEYSIRLSLYRNTTTSLVSSSVIRTPPVAYKSLPSFLQRTGDVDIAQAKFFDMSVAAGTHSYFYKAQYISSIYITSNTYEIKFRSLKTYVKEI